MATVDDEKVIGVESDVENQSEEEEEFPLPQRPVFISAVERLAKKEQELKAIQNEILAAELVLKKLGTPVKKEEKELSSPVKEEKKKEKKLKVVTTAEKRKSSDATEHAPSAKKVTPNNKDNDDEEVRPVIITICMDCPQHKIREVIGRKGIVISDIIDKSGCKVEIDKTKSSDGRPQSIKVTGQAHQLPIATTMINNIINAASEESEKNDEPDDGVLPLSVNVPCPQEKIGGIIGKKGCVIAEIIKKSGCKIEIDKARVSEGQPQQVLLTGKPKQLATAVALINEIINAPDERREGRRDDRRDDRRGDDRDTGRDSRSHRDRDNLTRDSGRDSHRDSHRDRDRDNHRDRDSRRVPDKDREPDFLCPQEKIGMVIGPKGANVNDILSRTGCKVQVEHDLPLVNGTDRIISFKGNANQVALAKAMVRVVIAMPDAPGYAAVHGGGKQQSQHQQQQQQQQYSQQVQAQPTMYQQTAQMGAMPAVTYGPYGAAMAFNPYPQQMSMVNGLYQMPISGTQPQQQVGFPLPTNSMPQQQMYQMANGQMMYAAVQPFMYGAAAVPQQQFLQQQSAPVYGLGSHADQMAQYNQYAQQQQQLVAGQQGQMGTLQLMGQDPVGQQTVSQHETGAPQQKTSVQPQNQQQTGAPVQQQNGGAQQQLYAQPQLVGGPLQQQGVQQYYQQQLAFNGQLQNQNQQLGQGQQQHVGQQPQVSAQQQQQQLNPFGHYQSQQQPQGQGQSQQGGQFSSGKR